jgi:hypothetical protein
MKCIINHHIFLYSEFTDKSKSNSHLPVSCRNCMNHRQALTATAATINHTTVQLSLTSCYVLFAIVFVDVVRYTVEQRVFLYELYVKYGSARKCRKKISS